MLVTAKETVSNIVSIFTFILGGVDSHFILQIIFVTWQRRNVVLCVELHEFIFPAY